MIKKKLIKTEKEEEVVDEVFCSFCGKEFDKTTTSCNGFGQIHISFGYGSIFDDEHFNLEVCDDCFLNKYFELLKDQFKEKGYDLNMLEESKNEKSIF